MAVVCPSINNVDQFSKSSRIKLYARRRKDYSKPLHVDCSVEYELPNSAKPPAGNKNEPLLMIHPSYYRREESKRRSQFVNNLPKRRTSTRYTRSTAERASENITNYVTNDYSLTRQRINCGDKRSIADNAQTLSKTSVPSTIFQTQTNFDNTCLQTRADCNFNKVSQSALPPTSACTAPKVHQVDIISLWRRTMETNPLSQSSSFNFNEMQGMTMMPVSERAPVPGPTPVPVSTSAHMIDSWMPNFPNMNACNDKHDNNNNGDDKYHNRIRDRSKKNLYGNGDNIAPYSSEAKPMKKGTIYSETSAPVPPTNSSTVTGNAGAITYHQQQQPAVGVAAIAATPLNCNNYSSTIPSVEGNRRPPIRQQPWSATTAPEFPPSSLPISHIVQKRPLIGIIYPDVPPRKRNSDNVSCWYDEYGNDDPSMVKRDRMAVNENTQICNARAWPTNESEYCKMYYSQEPRDCFNYSNSCAITGNAAVASCSNVAWNRSGDNLNALHLFRL